MTEVQPDANSLGVSRETFDQLAAYEQLLRKWTPKINLIAKSTLGAIWQRHIEDSLQIANFIPETAQSLTDLGSGGGLPAIVVSIVRPDIAVTMVESDKRKATFLRTCARELGLNARVITARIEETPPQNADVVTARALAPLPLLLDYVSRHLSPDGLSLLMKGQSTMEELAEARKTWSFAETLIASRTSADAHILRIERIARA